MIQRRLTILAILFLLWGAAIFLKLFSLQVIHHAEYVKRARARPELELEVPGPRGTI